MSDFLLDETGDIVFTPDGDLKTISGAALIAQDIREEARIPKGALPWAPEAGSDLFKYLNSNEPGADQAILSELERLALEDPQIDAASVKAEKTEMGFSLSFAPLTGEAGEPLQFTGGVNG